MADAGRGPSMSRAAAGRKAVAKSAETSAAKRGDALTEKLARIGVLREQDLVLHLPLRYEDRTELLPLAHAQAGRTVQTEGEVVSADI